MRVQDPQRGSEKGFKSAMRPKYLDPVDITKKVVITGAVLATSWVAGAVIMAAVALGSWQIAVRQHRRGGK